MLRKLIVALFHFLLFTVPLYFAWDTEELFEFNKMMLAYGVTVVIAGLWAVRCVVQKKILVRPTLLDLPLVLFLVSQILSTIFSMHPRTSLLGYYTRFHGGLLSTFAYVTLYYAFVNNVRKKDLPGLFFTTFVSAMVVAVYGILEHFGHSASCLLITGNFNVSCWVQDVQNRVFASFGQPNWLAAYAITLLPLGMGLSAKKTNRSWLKLFYGAATVLLFLVLLYTKSRSGILGFGVSVVLFGGGLVYYYWQNRDARLPKLLAGVAGALLVCALLAGTPYTPSLSSLNQPPERPAPAAVNRLDEGGTDSAEIRKIVWTGAFRVWQRYPILGSGVETFAYSYYQDRPVEHNLVSEWDFLYNKAHNEFLNYLATTGIVGLSAYVLLLGWFSMACLLFLKKNRAKQDEYLLVSGILAGTGALAVSNFFGFSTVMVTILQFVFFGILVVLRDETKQEDKTLAWGKLDWQQWVGLVLVAIAAFILLQKIMTFWSADKQFAYGKALFEAQQYSLSLTTVQAAILKNPQEALYYDVLSEQYAQLAAGLAASDQSTAAAQLSQTAVRFSDQALQLNPHHLNFYKTRARVLLMLSQLDPAYLQKANETLQTAQTKAPTDPKLVYNEALVELSLGNTDRARELLEKTVALKPDYGVARLELGKLHQATGETEQAREQYMFFIRNIDPENEEVRERLEEIGSQL